MATFILVHGAWMGAWVWRDIIPLLLAKGHKIITPDLPGLGDDQTLLKDINLDLYISRLSTLINEQKTRVILVGHSMAGMVISALGELMPEKIHSLIYLCAFLPQDGESLLDIVNASVNPHMQFDFSLHYNVCDIRSDLINNALFNCCSHQDIVFARPLMRTQATNIFSSKCFLTQEKFGSIPKTYIKCNKDNAITLEMQNKMITHQFVDYIYSIDTDHCPFFSSTRELEKILLLTS